MKRTSAILAILFILALAGLYGCNHGGSSVKKTPHPTTKTPVK